MSYSGCQRGPSVLVQRCVLRSLSALLPAISVCLPCFPQILSVSALLPAFSVCVCPAFGDSAATGRRWRAGTALPQAQFSGGAPLLNRQRKRGSSKSACVSWRLAKQKGHVGPMVTGGQRERPQTRRQPMTDERTHVQMSCTVQMAD
jgi:hypothetical protein